MISIKDYAKQNNVTYEAVRAQVKRYEDQLSGHIVREGRQQLLDDEAVAFLDERRQKNPVVVYQQSKDEAIEALRRELEGTYKKIALQADEINTLQRFKIETMEKRQQLEDARTAQERRQRELDQREADIVEEVRMAVQEATEAAKAVAAEELSQALTKARLEAQKAFEDADHLHRQELAARDEKIRELESRNLWHYLTARFRKKDKE